MHFNVTFICESPHTEGANKSVALFNGREITPNSVVLAIDDFQGSANTDLWYNEIRGLSGRLKNLTHPGENCVGKSFVGFEIYGVSSQPGIAYMSDNIDPEPCMGSTGNVVTDYDNELFAFFNHTLDLAMQDFQKISPLPGLVFTCPRCYKKFLPWSQIVWAIAVALGSFWTIVLFVVTGLVAHITKAFDPEYDLWLRTSSAGSLIPGTPGTPGYLLSQSRSQSMSQMSPPVSHEPSRMGSLTAPYQFSYSNPYQPIHDADMRESRDFIPTSRA